MRSKLVWLETALLLAPFLLLLALWQKLPARVPIHWNLADEIDGWGPKPYVLLGSLSAVGLIALLRVLPWLDPKLRTALASSGRMGSALQAFRLAIAGFFFLIFLSMFSAALGRDLPAFLIPSAVLLLFAALGNYTGNLRPNYFVGLRTPWTLENPETWRATHRLGGKLMFFGSLALLVLQFVVNMRVFWFAFLSAIVLFAIWTVVYSRHHFRTAGRSAQTSNAL